MIQFTLQRKTVRVQHYLEDLNGVALDMVLIPEGSFLMGSPDGEEGRREDEGPQHQVTLPSFFMGRYPITQAQWLAVADTEQFPKVKDDLNPAPSEFKGDNRPVDSINWHDAVEFCARLSRYSGRSYRLPSEAEWEYACRAGTTTPFHFGETLSAEVANYDASKSYGRGSQGEYRRETTPVGSFPANDFGLHDMHGNHWEWCLDHNHNSYDGAPIDGSAWIDENSEENQLRILRGGSWSLIPMYCRSAVRDLSHHSDRLNFYGFRVICELPRTL